MAASRWAIVCAGMLLAGGQLFPAWIEARQAGQAAPQAPADDNAVPSDLKSLLAAPESELRIVTQRYAIDRSTLNGNYDGGGRAGGRGGRGNPGGGGGGGTDGRAGRGTDPARRRPRRPCHFRRIASRASSDMTRAGRRHSPGSTPTNCRLLQRPTSKPSRRRSRATSPSSMRTRRRSRKSCRSCPSRLRSSSSTRPGSGSKT